MIETGWLPTETGGAAGRHAPHQIHIAIKISVGLIVFILHINRPVNKRREFDRSFGTLQIYILCICPYLSYMSYYPDAISEKLLNSKFSGEIDAPDTAGTAANLSCGAFARFFLNIVHDELRITELSYVTNGCGYMAAAAETVCEAFSERRLTELNGLSDISADEALAKVHDALPMEREQCLAICLDALRSALVSYRNARIGEFAGERALICTCFGVSEETVAAAIETGNLRTASDVAAECRAGSGCGACRMMIQELIDGKRRQFESNL